MIRWVTTTRHTAPKQKHTRSAARLAWVLWGLSVVLSALGVLLVALSHHSNVHVFDYWLEGTVIALVFSPVGAVIVAHRSRHLVGWIFCAIGLVAATRTLGADYAAYALLWAIAFVALSATGGLGDRHRGQWLPFWDQACRDGRPRACAYLANLQSIYCGAGSGWACNESGLFQRDQAGSDTGRQRSALSEMNASFERGCSLGFVPACRNAGRLWTESQALERAPPTLADYPIVLRGSKGPIADRTPSALHARACEQGWRDTCGSTIR